MIDCINNFEKHLEDVIKTDGIFDAKEYFKISFFSRFLRFELTINQ